MALILIADDSPDNLEILSEFLSDEGHAIILAGNAAEAVEAAIEQRPEVILMDLQMPDSSASGGLNERAGFDACQRIGGELGAQRPAIIVLSGYATTLSESKLTAEGCDGVASKPYDFSALLETIDKVTATDG